MRWARGTGRKSDRMSASAQLRNKRSMTAMPCDACIKDIFFYFSSKISHRLGFHFPGFPGDFPIIFRTSPLVPPLDYLPTLCRCLSLFFTAVGAADPPPPPPGHSDLARDRAE